MDISVVVKNSTKGGKESSPSFKQGGGIFSLFFIYSALITPKLIIAKIVGICSNAQITPDLLWCIVSI